MDLFDMQEGFNSLTEGLSRVVCPCMVIGVQTDILFPVWQQRDLAEGLQNAGKSLSFLFMKISEKTPINQWVLKFYWQHSNEIIQINKGNANLKKFFFIWTFVLTLRTNCIWFLHTW